MVPRLLGRGRVEVDPSLEPAEDAPELVGGLATDNLVEGPPSLEEPEVI